MIYTDMMWTSWLASMPIGISRMQPFERTSTLSVSMATGGACWAIMVFVLCMCDGVVLTSDMMDWYPQFVYIINETVNGRMALEDDCFFGIDEGSVMHAPYSPLIPQDVCYSMY